MRGPSRPDRARTDCTRQGGRGSMRLTVLHALRALVALLVVTLGLFLGPASSASTLKVNCAQGGNLEAAMSGSAAQGGGILTQGSLSAIDSRIVDNRSTAVGAGAFAAGAGVNVETTVTMTDSVVSGNQATASSPSATPTAEGGGIVAG